MLLCFVGKNQRVAKSWDAPEANLAENRYPHHPGFCTSLAGMRFEAPPSRRYAVLMYVECTVNGRAWR
jgi:hypothetical protein